MSFYQEYLKKQKGLTKESPEEETQDDGPKEEEVIEKKDVDPIKEKIEDGPEVDAAPPAMPVQINSDNANGKFSEMQKREEVERQKFISRVKGENVPLPEIVKSEPKEEDVKINVPQKPPRSEKVLIRIIVVLALVAILATISLLWYRTVKNGGTAPAEVIREVETEEVFVPEIVAPVSLFNYDLFEYPLITRPNEFSTHLLQYMSMETEEEALVKIMFRDQRDRRNPTFMTARSFLNTFSIAMPSPFGDRVDQESLNVFIHSRDESNEVGFAVIIDDAEGFTGMMREWEDNAARDVNQFLSLLGKETQTESQIFTPLTHRQNVIRCLDYQNDSEVCYSTIRDSLTDIFVFATSSDTVRALIDSL